MGEMGNSMTAAFLTGLFTGGLTCLAVQGGLLATTIAKRSEEKLKEQASSGHTFPILSFLTAKLIVYTLAGGMLGWLGSFFQLSLSANAALQIGVGIFMFATALNMLGVHPIFRYVVIQPPKFLTRLVRTQSKSKDVFTPAILGAFTIFIPCGTTQAMMALAVASGNPVLGASILFAFTLGTSPLFFVLGYFTTKLGDVLQAKFMKVAASAIILIATFNVNNALALSGSNVTLQTAWEGFWCTFSFCESSALFASSATLGAAVQEATITIEGAGYRPNNLVVRAGSDVNLRLVNTSGGGCTQAFTIPKLGVQKVIPLGTSDVVQFTAPNEPGELAFMCGMGMFGGKIRVI